LSTDSHDLPNIAATAFAIPDVAHLHVGATKDRPRILILYESLRAWSLSRFLSLEAARLLEAFGAEVRVFNPSGLPLPDDAPAEHPKVQELRELSSWSEGQVWCSPERYGAMTGIMKAQIDWIPLSLGAVRPIQGKTLAVMQVSGGSQSFNAVNQLRVLGPMDADDHHLEPVLRTEGLRAIRRGGPDEAFSLLRPRRGCDGGAGKVHVAHARRLGIPHEPLQ
jgi:arsenical resistance protein ArsH